MRITADTARSRVHFATVAENLGLMDHPEIKNGLVHGRWGLPEGVTFGVNGARSGFKLHVDFFNCSSFGFDTTVGVSSTRPSDIYEAGGVVLSEGGAMWCRDASGAWGAVHQKAKGACRSWGRGHCALGENCRWDHFHGLRDMWERARGDEVRDCEDRSPMKHDEVMVRDSTEGEWVHGKVVSGSAASELVVNVRPSAHCLGSHPRSHRNLFLLRCSMTTMLPPSLSL
jgi:hypothetical protein